ncbi:hypothetical protein N8D74_04435 [Curtobacterium flaccumfaciens]|uniref:Uncharacterized protein n=1 Tax=Curtobacterium poinsettiae TaxID=159612 RepID=A0A9Q9T3L3_9MICO|nr:hypothetical protein [Curtobacterium flaccumfaciens]UXN26135.1 hypothetical protein N8D74_04435 [Curtobacterium flaccumfaciens]UYC80977.1 hypothetical protein OE229_00515 [Curtobacterium flaccumfaciens pv. poinsettiae]
MTIAILQAVTASVAGITAVINFVMLFKRQKDSSMQLIRDQSKAMERSSKRLSKSLDQVNTQVVERLANIDSKLSHVQAVVDRL